MEKIVNVDLKDGDYTLVDGNAWFTIKKFSVRISSTDDGMKVGIWVKGKELEAQLNDAYAFDHECEED